MSNRDLIEAARVFIATPMEGRDPVGELLRATGLIEQLADELSGLTELQGRGIRCRECRCMIAATHDAHGVVWRDFTGEGGLECSGSPEGHYPSPAVAERFVTAYDVVRGGGTRDQAARKSGLRADVVSRAFPAVKVRAEA